MKTEAPTGRKVLFWKITGDALAVIHAPPNTVFGSKSEGRRSYTVTRAEVGADVIPRLSFGDVFIIQSGMPIASLGSWKNEFNLWKMRGHFRHRGDHACPNERAAVTKAVDLKILFIKVYL